MRERGLDRGRPQRHVQVAERVQGGEPDDRCPLVDQVGEGEGRGIGHRRADEAEGVRRVLPDPLGPRQQGFGQRGDRRGTEFLQRDAQRVAQFGVAATQLAHQGSRQRRVAALPRRPPGPARDRVHRVGDERTDPPGVGGIAQLAQHVQRLHPRLPAAPQRLIQPGPGGLGQAQHRPAEGLADGMGGLDTQPGHQRTGGVDLAGGAQVDCRAQPDVRVGVAEQVDQGFWSFVVIMRSTVEPHVA
ncbi:MAG: hypothetical protein HZY73_15395 [Micropruina sp.]|nr:MAG: hypothetical protein HZY73_15395 [Micropruina sp.]